MKCPECKSEETKVTTKHDNEFVVLRTRTCADCGVEAKTVEIWMPKDGKRLPPIDKASLQKYN